MLIYPNTPRSQSNYAFLISTFGKLTLWFLFRFHCFLEYWIVTCREEGSVLWSSYALIHFNLNKIFITYKNICSSDLILTLQKKNKIKLGQNDLMIKNSHLNTACNHCKNQAGQKQWRAMILIWCRTFTKLSIKWGFLIGSWRILFYYYFFFDELIGSGRILE